MPAVPEKQKVHTTRKKLEESQLLTQIANFLLREHLITPEERIRFLAGLKKEG